ncbi:uncharacterized protein LOC131939889 [Physella acuta]|uniref:uncharacterized protein LOC131939889 n=1 Tax=Physella acuta TaxID=109671 RepID=UPI0027DD8CB6|nr:uncharacterized protein LOC131939889 [Physella acuta]
MGVTRVLVTTKYLLLMIVDTTFSQCPEGWFGNKCEYQCHCQDQNCDASGACPVGAKCARSYFGFACQYYNIMDQRTADYLLDDDDTTCSKAEITAATNDDKTDQIFTFAWIVLSKKAAIRDLKFSFLNADRRSVVCSGWVFTDVTSKIVELRCTNNILFTKFKVTTKSAVEVCGLYIGRGRSVALKQVTSSSDLQHADVRADTVVDGHRYESPGTGTKCFGTVSRGLRAYLGLILEKPILVFSVDIYTRQANSQDKIAVKLIDTSGFEKEALQPGRSRTSGVFEYKLSSPELAMGVKITSVGRKEFSVCEVEVYGDCAAGQFGLDCKHSCEQCHSQLCEMTGICLSCEEKQGFTSCRKVCGKCAGNKQCDEDTAVCVDGCLHGYRGDRCNMLCDPCPNNSTCDRYTGACDQCPKGFFGDDCQKPCTNCAGDGSCMKEDGYCVDGCKNLFMGDFCQQTCPNCRVSCDRETGYCAGECREGYWSISCDED